MKKFVCFIFLLVLVPAIGFAQTSPIPATNGCTAVQNSTATQLGTCVNQVYIWSLGIAALLALFMIVIGGYITLTAAGNAERASRGKNYIQSSLIGLVLLFGAYILLKTINPDLVNFNVSSFNTTQPGTPIHQ